MMKILLWLLFFILALSFAYIPEPFQTLFGSVGWAYLMYDLFSSIGKMGKNK